MHSATPNGPAPRSRPQQRAAGDIRSALYQGDDRPSVGGRRTAARRGLGTAQRRCMTGFRLRRGAGRQTLSVQDLDDGVQQVVDIVGVKVADGADAEAVGAADLAGVDDRAAIRQAAIEGGEVEAGLAGSRNEVMIGESSARTGRCGSRAGSCRRASAADWPGSVAAARPGRLPIQLDERLMQSEQRMHRRRKAELTIAIEAGQLAQRSRLTLRA